MIGRICLGLAAAGAIFAGGAICLVALAMALYALVLPSIGPAAASAVVAAAAAFVICLGALIISLAARAPRPRKTPNAGPLDRLVAFVRTQPVLAISASVAAGFFAVRNPKYLGDAMRAFLDEGSGRRQRR